MKKISTAILGALGLVALASACSVETMEAPVEDVGTSEEALVCSNDQATFAIMAAMATAAADEMRRWLPRRDLVWNYSTGRLELTNYGTARCPYNSAGQKECKTMKKLLALQNDSAVGMQFGGSEMRPEILRNRLKSYWDRQVVCLDRPDNGMADNCPAEYHDLTRTRTEVSATTCAGGLDFWYDGKYQGTSTPLAAADAAQLKNMLLWAGGTDNPFLSFYSVGDDVKIDPIDGTTGGSGSGAGCEMAKNPVWSDSSKSYKCDNTNVDKTPPAGSPYYCCSCGGQNRNWKPAMLAGYWTCKL